MSSLATQGLSAAASLTSVMLPHEIAEALRSKYGVGISRIPLTESAVGLFNRPISPMCVQCLFCTRDYDLMGVMYGGRFIFVCPSCGERCIESDDDSGGYQGGAMRTALDPNPEDLLAGALRINKELDMPAGMFPNMAMPEHVRHDVMNALAVVATVKRADKTHEAASCRAALGLVSDSDDDGGNAGDPEAGSLHTVGLHDINYYAASFKAAMVKKQVYVEGTTRVSETMGSASLDAAVVIVGKRTQHAAVSLKCDLSDAMPPHQRIQWIDEKPYRFNSAGGDEVWARRGTKTVKCKENRVALLERWTGITAVYPQAYGGSASDERWQPVWAALFKAIDGSRCNVHAPDDSVLVLFAEHGSITTATWLTYLNFILPVVDNPRDALVLTTDWYAPHLAAEAVALTAERTLSPTNMIGGGCTAQAAVCDQTPHRVLAQTYTLWEITPVHELLRRRAVGRVSIPQGVRGNDGEGEDDLECDGRVRPGAF